MCQRVAQRSDNRRFFALIGVSLVIHAAVALGVAALPETPRPPPVQKPLEMEFVVSMEDEPPKPAPVVEPPQPVARTIEKKKTNQQPTPTPTPVPSVNPNPTTAVNDSPKSEGVGNRGDMPVNSRPSLTPSQGFIISLGTGGAKEEAPRGTTVRNGPGEEPDQRAVNEYTSETLSRKLNNQFKEDIGLAAVAAGNVPAHFKRYESAMRTALPKTKIESTPLTAKEGLAEVAGALFNSGPSAQAQANIANSPLGRSIQQQNVMTPNVDDQRGREAMLGMMSAAENIKEHLQRPRLRTIIEMTTDATGGVADASIIEKSGDPKFDESVLHFSRKVARQVPDSDDKMLGTSMWRTRWQFTLEFPNVKVRLINAWRVDAEPQAQ